MRLVFKSDIPINIHLHGYDIKKTISPNTDTSMEIFANATGRFNITSHSDRGRRLGNTNHHKNEHSSDNDSDHEQVLMTLEVHP